MTDIGNMAWGLRDNVTDLCDIWLSFPHRRREFAERELSDIRAAHTKLGLLLSAIDASAVKEVA